MNRYTDNFELFYKSKKIKNVKDVIIRLRVILCVLIARKNSIRNADMNKKGTVRVISTSMTKNIVKILI